MPLPQSGKHAHVKDLIMHGADEDELVPKASFFIHYAQSVPPTRTKRLEHFFGPEVLLRDTFAAQMNPEHDNMLGNTKAGANAIDKDLLYDFRDHWDSFCVLEKQQVLMSFMQMDPELLKVLGKDGRESIFDIIDNKAQMDEDPWVVTLSRVMRNFPRSHSIRANSADRESWYFLNKKAEEGMEAGFQAASSSTSAALPHDSEEHAQQRKAKRCKLEMNDSIPPMGASITSSCWPRKRQGRPAEYDVVGGVTERVWKPIRDAVREDIKTTFPGYKLVCDYDRTDPIRAGMRPGIDLVFPCKTFVEHFQTEFKHRFKKEHLADESAWDNDAIHRNGEWQKKPDAERVLEKKSLLGFERTSKDSHAAHASSSSGGLSSNLGGGRWLQLPATKEFQEIFRSRRGSSPDSTRY